MRAPPRLTEKYRSHSSSGHVLKERLSGDAGIVDEQRNGAKSVIDRFEHGVNFGAAGNVRLYCDGAAALARELCDQLVGLVLALVIVHAHGIAFAGKLRRDGAADAAGGAGNEGNFIILHHTAPHFPVEPKPPVPRSVSESSATSANSMGR